MSTATMTIPGFKPIWHNGQMGSLQRHVMHWSPKWPFAISFCEMVGRVFFFFVKTNTKGLDPFNLIILGEKVDGSLYEHAKDPGICFFLLLYNQTFSTSCPTEQLSQGWTWRPHTSICAPVYSINHLSTVNRLCHSRRLHIVPVHWCSLEGCWLTEVSSYFSDK